MDKKQLKGVIISLLVGAGTAFFATLFQELANFLKANSTQLIAGGVASFHHLAKNFRV